MPATETRPPLTAESSPDAIRAHLRATGWRLADDGWWWSPLAYGPDAPKGVSVFGIHDTRWGHADPAIQAAGVREIERAETANYR